MGGSSPDLEAYEEALEQAAGHMVQAHVAMAKAATEARTVLTPEQHERLQRSIQMMRSMMGEPGSGGMMDRDGPRY